VCNELFLSRQAFCLRFQSTDASFLNFFNDLQGGFRYHVAFLEFPSIFQYLCYG